MVANIESENTFDKSGSESEQDQIIKHSDAGSDDEDSAGEDQNSLWYKMKAFLRHNENIQMVSEVETSKYFGMSAEKSVMLLTSSGRLLLVDPNTLLFRKQGKMHVMNIASTTVIDYTNFKLDFVTKKMKFKCSEPVAYQWKRALDQMHESYDLN